MDSILLKFEIQVPFVECGQYIAVCGSDSSLGSWKIHNSLTLHPDEDVGTVWKGQCVISKNRLPLEYKFVMRDQSGILMWEGGANRVAATLSDGANVLVLSCRSFRYTCEYWAKTRLKIPVDILRSVDSFAVRDMYYTLYIISYIYHIYIYKYVYINVYIYMYVSNTLYNNYIYTFIHV
jgi:hypothetical protein